MNILTLITGLLISIAGIQAQEINTDKTALILIDIQNFYFSGGKIELVEPDMASENAASILKKFRDEDMLIVHIKHNFESGGEIHPNVKPNKDEKVIVKEEVSAFNGTDLKEYLDEYKIEHLVLVGMQTHMCLEGTTRAAYDLGYDCIIVGDACATRDLIYDDHTILAIDVHYSTLKTLESYAKVVTTETLLKQD